MNGARQRPLLVQSFNQDAVRFPFRTRFARLSPGRARPAYCDLKNSARMRPTAEISSQNISMTKEAALKVLDSE